MSVAVSNAPRVRASATGDAGKAGSSLREEELSVEVIEGRDAFGALEREWNAALAKGPRDEPMLRHEWTRAWIENFAPGATLRTFVARAGHELHAALPLIESIERNADTCFLAMRTWSLPGNDHSQRGGFLLGGRGEEALRLIWEQLMEAPGWDRLRIRDLPDGAPEWQLREMAERAGYPCGLWVSLRSPYLKLPQRYEEVEAAVDGKFRQNLRRRKRRLAEQGEVKYLLVEGRDAKQLDEALADFFVIEASGWKGKGGTAIAQRPELVGFYTQIARDAAKRKGLALGFLELGGKRIAAHLSILHAGRSYLLKLGYDEKFHEFSPGQQLVSEAIRDACGRGLAEFDFLGPCMEWKLDWEPALRTHTWLTIFRPTRAGILVHGARNTVWPVLRALLRRRK
jgi:CelD/BcsL family acetyltransferase involved in cellulose biosynthesis